MASFFCHVVAGAKQFRLERIVRPLPGWLSSRGDHAGDALPVLVIPMCEGTGTLGTELDGTTGPTPNATAFIFAWLPVEASEISKNEITPYAIVPSDIEIKGQLVDLAITDTRPQRPWVVEEHSRSVGTGGLALHLGKHAAHGPVVLAHMGAGNGELVGRSGLGI